MAQTRNNLTHKSGIVDSWFMKQCPWLINKYEIGDSLIINHSELYTWMDSAIAYCNEIQKKGDKAFWENGNQLIVKYL